jgi:hypothetical protein
MSKIPKQSPKFVTNYLRKCENEKYLIKKVQNQTLYPMIEISILCTLTKSDLFNSKLFVIECDNNNNNKNFKNPRMP